jgi:hypothetical protein
MQELVKQYLEAKRAEELAASKKKAIAKQIASTKGVSIGSLTKDEAETFQKIVAETEAGKVTIFATVRQSYDKKKVEKFLSPQQKVAARKFACFTSVKVSGK